MIPTANIKRPVSGFWIRVVSAAVTLGILYWAMGGVELSWDRIVRGLPSMGRIIGLMVTNPEWSLLPDIGIGLLQSLEIAFLGTAIASILALPFGVLAARNLSRFGFVAFVGKTLLNLIRTFPELILAIAFIQGLGPGASAGVLAVGVHSVGMIGKLYAERIENVDKGSLESLSAAGASPIEVFRYGVLPDVLPDFVSFALYRFDLNVRSASVLGIVGAGGIGTLLIQQRSSGKWGGIGLIVVGIILTVGIVDTVSARLRAHLK